MGEGDRGEDGELKIRVKPIGGCAEAADGAGAAERGTQPLFSLLSVCVSVCLSWIVFDMFNSEQYTLILMSFLLYTTVPVYLYLVLFIYVFLAQHFFFQPHIILFCHVTLLIAYTFG